MNIQKISASCTLFLRKLALLGLFLFTMQGFAAASHAASESYRSSTSEARMVTEKSIVPGVPFTVKLELSLKPEWHTYTDPPGEAGMATTIEWMLPDGFTAGPIEWPPHATFDEGNITTYGYSGKVALPVTITPTDTLAPGTTVTLSANANWLVCHEICIPESHRFTLTLPVAAPGTSGTALEMIPADAGGENFSLPLTLFLALLGGMVLNLMPCVFPVLSLKTLAIARSRSMTAAQARAEGIAYTLGILASFGVLAGILISLKSAGASLGWGYQMQSPVFVSFLALLLFAIGLNLSGVFHLPVLLGNAGQKIAREPTLSGSFLTGVLAALVATPCTAPFMAAAVGAALTQPAPVAFLIFEMLGLGLALPFLLISFLPALRRCLPRPGAWMERFKEFLAFPMYLSAVWLIWVLSRQSSSDSVALVLCATTGMAFLLWLSRLWHGWMVSVLVAALMIVTLKGVALMDRMPTQEKPSLLHEGSVFSLQEISRLRGEGKGVLVDATAAWCITCQINYQTTLGTTEIKNFLEEKNIVYMVADWTRADAHITDFLASFNRRGVPLYVYYPAKGEPVVLPQLLTPGAVKEAVLAAP